jgi:hypothetical protein
MISKKEWYQKKESYQKKNHKVAKNPTKNKKIKND